MWAGPGTLRMVKYLGAITTPTCTGKGKNGYQNLESCSRQRGSPDKSFGRAHSCSQRKPSQGLWNKYSNFSLLLPPHLLTAGQPNGNSQGKGICWCRVHRGQLLPWEEKWVEKGGKYIWTGNYSVYLIVVSVSPLLFHHYISKVVRNTTACLFFSDIR